jgi:hypothetical protein
VSCDPGEETGIRTWSNLLSVDTEGNTLISEQEMKAGLTGSDNLTTEQIEWLKFMREEEKLAHDLYLELSHYHALPIFTNITRAEETHMNAVLAVLSAYSIPDPASAEPGKFQNPDLQELYNTLLDQGKVGRVEALQAGALVEESDILDLAGIYEMEPESDLIALAEALMLGSRNHLRAFTRVLKVNSVVYEPVALTAEDFASIINSSWEQGTGFCGGDPKLTGSGYCQGGGRGFRGGR